MCGVCGREVICLKRVQQYSLNQSLDPPIKNSWIRPFFPTRIGSTVPKCQKLCIRLVVGIARIPTLQKQSEGCMTEKLNILRGSQVPVMHLLSQTTSRQLVTTSNGSTLRYWQKVGLIPIVRLKETLLIQELKPTLNDNVSSEKLYLH